MYIIALNIHLLQVKFVKPKMIFPCILLHIHHIENISDESCG